MNCSKCGRELRIGTEQVGIDNKQLPIFHRFGYCDTCMLKTDLDLQPTKKEKKKDSVLSLLSAIFGFFTCTSFIGFVIGIVDLCMDKNKEKRHIGSIFGIVMCCLWVLILLINIDETDNLDITTTEAISTQAETQEESSTEVIEDNIINVEHSDCHLKYLKHEIVENMSGDKCIAIYYEFTNNSDTGQTFDYTFNDKAFQNGVQMEMSMFHVNDDSKASDSEIKPGVTLTVCSAFVIREEGVDVELEITPWIDVNEILDTMTLTFE